MATLILTAVGTAIGGPVGAAIGGLIGQGIDRRVLAPKRREGPRLTELAVQTSSYGTQIPKLFGTMRVAGTVIWATDLIETRGRSGGAKGQPRVDTYSYSASFAVALSARAIVGVGRIWADGKLIRGQAGDFKVATGFRVHRGDEDQVADPLIASIEGVDTPACRGIAYAVFEGLALGEFGNRIPSLTFEVVADAGAVSTAAIAGALADEVEAGDAGLALDGFAAAGGSVGAVLETLAQASGAWFGAKGARLVMRSRPGPIVTLSDEGVAAGDAVPRRGRTIAAAQTVPRAVSVAHYDPARDWQTGVQRARVPGAAGLGAGVREEQVAVPAAMSAASAKGIALAMLARAEAGRVRRTVALGFSAMVLRPGDAVRIAGEAGVWRVVSTTLEAMVVRLVLVPVTRAAVPVAADGGRVLGSVDAPVGRTILRAFELPVAEERPSGPMLAIVATGEGAGWRRAALMLEAAGLDDAGATAAPGVIGTVVEAAAPAPYAIIDRAGAFVVTLARGDMMLGDADDTRLDAGANLALIGGELVQFARAEPLGNARWRLSELLRGRQGIADPVAAGDAFVLIERETLRTVTLGMSAIGSTVRVMAAGIGDGDTPALAEVTITGAGLRPLSPVHLRWAIQADGGAVLRWVRRSRAGRWIDGVDAPLGEEREAYRVVVTRGDGGGDGLSRTVETTAPLVEITPVERAAGCAVSVAMLGRFGASAAAETELIAGGV